jgi:Transposase
MGSTYAGVDWASEKHDVLIADETGERIVAATFAHDEAGVRGLCRALVRHEVTLVAIERPDGLGVGRFGWVTDPEGKRELVFEHQLKPLADLGGHRVELWGLRLCCVRMALERPGLVTAAACHILTSTHDRALANRMSRRPGLLGIAVLASAGFLRARFDVGRFPTGPSARSSASC